MLHRENWQKWDFSHSEKTDSSKNNKKEKKRKKVHSDFSEILTNVGLCWPLKDLCGIETSNRLPTAWCQPVLFFQQTTKENSHCRVRHPTKPLLLSCWKLCSLAFLPFCFFPPELSTICRLSATCAMFKCVHTLQEEKYVGSELILFLTYREIPVVFNLDCGIQELYWEEKWMCFEQKNVYGEFPTVLLPESWTTQGKMTST